MDNYDTVLSGLTSASVGGKGQIPDYKKALDKAVDYIITHTDYCQICVNKETCARQQEIVKRNKIYHSYYPYLGICKDSVRQHFIRQAEADNGTK